VQKSVEFAGKTELFSFSRKLSEVDVSSKSFMHTTHISMTFVICRATGGAIQLSNLWRRERKRHSRECTLCWVSASKMACFGWALNSIYSLTHSSQATA